MRTTVTLDPDVERLLAAAMRERGISFKQALNDAIRAGLVRKASVRKPRFRQRVLALGRAQLFRWDKALATADEIENEEILRRISLRK